VELADTQHGVISRRQLLAAGLSARSIERRIEASRLHVLHSGVYALGIYRVSLRGRWMAAVLACGDNALLSHRSAAALWGLTRHGAGPVDVLAPVGRRKKGVVIHQGRVDAADRESVDSIPVTSVARTLFDLAEVVDSQRLERAWEEADRLRLLELKEVERVLARGHGRRALKPIRALMEAALEPVRTRSPLEERFAIFCRKRGFPPSVSNVTVLDREVDVLWPRERVIVELDGFKFHGHRAAFERDRTRDAALVVAGYRVLHLTHLRLDSEPDEIDGEIRSLLGLGGGRPADATGRGDDR
jgi:predicted transcriptional regulator of viral defense system